MEGTLYTFDSLNRLATAQKPGNALYTMAYDADSRRTTMMLGNGTTRKYQFDNRGQLTTQIEYSGATPLCTIVDGYDPVGNRLTRNLDGNPITWTYDDLYRLTGQQKAGQVCTYTLDGVGNLKTMWEGGNFPKTFTFNAADRLVTMVEGASLTTYAWTGYGALESEITGNSTTGYAYNGQDQLAVVTAPTGDKTTYSFDGDGLRRSVATTNVSQDPPTLDVTTMVWDGSDYLLLNEPTQNRVVLTLDSEIVSCGSKDLLTDPLGSLVKEISSGASLGSLIELYPYGTRASALTKISIPFVYIAAYGYYTDSAERDYVRARELYKTLGRWMQTDPSWPHESAFQYARANPIAFADFWGMQADGAFVGAMAGGMLGAAGGGCCSTGQKPCTDLLGGISPDDKDTKALLDCLLRAGKDRTEIEKCLDKFGGKIKDKAWEALRRYLACVMAASTCTATDCDPPTNPCNPPMKGCALSCCYQKFLNCLFKCSGKNGSTWGLCIEKCRVAKGGFIDCLAEHSGDEADWGGS